VGFEFGDHGVDADRAAGHLNPQVARNLHHVGQLFSGPSGGAVVPGNRVWCRRVWGWFRGRGLVEDVGCPFRLTPIRLWCV
jgi:hypothetical protein